LLVVTKIVVFLDVMSEGVSAFFRKGHVASTVEVTAPLAISEMAASRDGNHPLGCYILVFPQRTCVKLAFRHLSSNNLSDELEPSELLATVKINEMGSNEFNLPFLRDGL
jgi:hypothetical protein